MSNLREEFKGFLATNGLNQSTVARSLGVSASLVSMWLKGTYKGDKEAFDKKIRLFMDNFSKKDLIEAEEIVSTIDVRMINFTIDEAIVTKDMCLIYGEAGSGKTTAIKEYVKSHPEAILVEVIPGMSAKSLLKEIALKINVNGLMSIEELVTAISRELSRREAVLIIDETENLTTRTLELVRRIWDFSRVPTVFVGTYNVMRNFKGRNGELLQLYSRINGKWEMQGLTESDAKVFFGEFAGEIMHYTKHLRRALNIYKKAKRLANISGAELNSGFIKEASGMVILD